MIKLSLAFVGGRGGEGSGVRVAWWWEHSPPTDVVWVKAICGLSLFLVLKCCLERFFSRYSGFLFLLKMFELNISPIRWGHLRGQERNDTEEREREISAGPRCLFYHACSGVSLTTSNVLVTCDTTYWTGLHENNCELRNFQHAVSIGHVNSTLTLTGFENHPVSMTDVVGGYIKVSGTGRGLSLPCKHALINYSWIIRKRRERSRKSGNA